jgi:2-amino-4-hydroxy-6-hydroxymethyldihydropteridine diphosphokinase
MNISYLLIGGNEGDRTGQLAVAREKIAAAAGSVVLASALYETAPWGKNDQADFLNQALKVETSLEAPALMDRLLSIEEQMGRRRLERYGSRLIDIDILFFNDAILQTPHLTLPHPEIQNRRFALAPMAEIASGYIHPVLKLSIEQLLASCIDPLAVKKLNI